MGQHRRHHRRTAAIGVCLVAASLAAVLGSVPVAAADRWITVRSGDTLGAIALRLGVSVEAIAASNGLEDPDRIFAGQQLRVPGAGGQAAAPRTGTHLVRAGDTLWDIAFRYGVSVQDLVTANRLTNPSLIHPGQRLSLGQAEDGPDAEPPAQLHQPGGPASDAPATREHRVAPGETLWSIANRYATSIDALVEANRLANPSLIYAGQVLLVPGQALSGSPLPAEMAELVRARRDVRHLIAAEARRQGVPVAFALAVAWQESGWQQQVRSSAGAIGIMQLLPTTAEWVGLVMLGEPVDPTRAGDNVRAGVRLLRHYLSRYGDRSLALAAYYQGQRATDEYGIYPSSLFYVQSILALEALFVR